MRARSAIDPLQLDSVVLLEMALQRIMFAEDRFADNDFVQVFTDAFAIAETDAALHDENPWGDEVSDHLLPGEIITRYSSLCHTKSPQEDQEAHLQYLVTTVPASLKQAYIASPRGQQSTRVVQFFLSFLEELMPSDQEEEDEDSSTEAPATESEKVDDLATTDCEEKAKETTEEKTEHKIEDRSSDNTYEQ